LYRYADWHAEQMKKPAHRREMVKALERSLGVPLTPVRSRLRGERALYLAVLPKDHPVAKKARNRRLLIDIYDVTAWRFAARRRRST